VLRVGPLMNAQEAANTTWSFATLGLMPGAEAWAALEAAVVRVGLGMDAQNVSNTIWSVFGCHARSSTPRVLSRSVAGSLWIRFAVIIQR
jgi:hypothetical protein